MVMTIFKISLALFPYFSKISVFSVFSYFRTLVLSPSWAAKRPANEPLTGLFSGPLTAQFYLLFLMGPLTSRYLFMKSLSTFIFLSNVVERL